jgi:fructose-bisphosphate aldolase class I
LALSGGYTQEEANAVLSKQRGMIASFSRALSETLSAQQSDEEFDEALGKSIFSIMAASRS